MADRTDPDEFSGTEPRARLEKNRTLSGWSEIFGLVRCLPGLKILTNSYLGKDLGLYLFTFKSETYGPLI